jgi:hypothetical protein
VSAQERAAFNRYLRWLSFSEQQRTRLEAVLQSTRPVIEPPSPAKNAGRPSAAGEEPGAETLAARKLLRVMQRETQRYGALVNRCLASKPPLPEDCSTLDSLYTAALRGDADARKRLCLTFPGGSTAPLKKVNADLQSIPTMYAAANGELASVLSHHGLKPKFEIQSTYLDYR